MKTYGLYINPYPGVWFYPSRLKSEARHSGLAWWIKGDSQDDAMDYFIQSCPPDMRDYLQKYRDDSQHVLIEESNE